MFVDQRVLAISRSIVQKRNLEHNNWAIWMRWAFWLRTRTVQRSSKSCWSKGSTHWNLHGRNISNIVMFFFQNWIWYINTNNNNVHNIIIPNPCVLNPTFLLMRHVIPNRHDATWQQKHQATRAQKETAQPDGGRCWWISKKHLQKHLFEEYFWKMQRKKMEKCSNKS